MLALVEFPPDTEESISCESCGVSGLDDFESWFSELATCGRYIGESGNYCDDCFPRCYCADCQ